MKQKSASLRFFLSALIFISSQLNAQDSTLQPFRIEKGVYKTFRAINNKTPDITGQIEIVHRDKGNIILVGGGPLTFKVDSLDIKQYRATRKKMVGVSDGQNFYISNRLTGGGYMSVSKCYLTGPYLLNFETGSLADYTGGGLVPAPVKMGNGYVIDLVNKKSTKLSKKYLRELMAAFPSIEQEYKDEDHLTKKAAAILQKINDHILASN
jgi:hypothetical protein